MIKQQLIVGAALLVGVAVGYFVRDDAPASSHDFAPTLSPRPTPSIPDKADDARVAALRQRLAEMEARLAACSNAPVETARTPTSPAPRGPREWLEQVRKNDPARYAQMTNRFARWRARRAQQARSRMEFLSSVDTSHMSAAAQKTHTELQELIAQREALEEQLHAEGLSDDQRRELMDEMRETDQALRKLNGEERVNLIAETARNLGFDETDAQTISATIQDVIQATESPRGPGGGPPPGGGGPSGPGGGPAGGR